MRIGVEKKWWLYIGRGFYFDNCRFIIAFAAVYRPEATIDEMPWRIHWRWRIGIRNPAPSDAWRDT